MNPNKDGKEEYKMDYDQNQSPSPQKRKNNWLLYIVVGFIIGACIVVLALPSLIKMDMLPEAWTPAATDNASQQDDDINTTNTDFPTQNLRSEEHTSELQLRFD